MTRLGSGRSQHGVSLLLALIFVTFFGGILVTLARFNSYEIRIAEARVVGWEIVEIARAARLYVRDRYSVDPSLRISASTPTRISINTLKNAGYLPSNFGREVSGNDLSALNQQIYVIMVNWSGAGALGGPTTDTTTVPTAFVYFDANGKTAPDLMVNAIETARRLGASINGVLFDRDGNNRSADCRGDGPGVSIWDTGCLTNTEFQVMASAIGIDPAFAPGSLIIPAWKSVQPDLRAVLRFPQPENPGFATMLTDLEMGTPVATCGSAAGQVSITTDTSGGTVGQSTGLCNVISDTATEDRRFNIDRIGNIQAQRMITEGQSTDYQVDVVETSNIGTADDDTMRISGTLVLNNDLRVFNEKPMPTAGTNVPSHRFSVPSAQLVVERNSYLYSTDENGSQTSPRSGRATIGMATARNLVSDQLDTANFNSTVEGLTIDPLTGDPVAPQISVTDRTELTNNLSVTGHISELTGEPDAELITEDLIASGAHIRATDDTGEVQVGQVLTMNPTSTMNVNGSGDPINYAAIVGEMTNSQNIVVTGQPSGPLGPDLRFMSNNASLSTRTTAGYTGGTPMPTISTTRCLESADLAGGCPERQYYPPNITP